MDQSVVDGKRDSSMFSDDEAENESDWMDVTVIDETQNSVEVSSSSVSFNASETSIDFLAAIRVNSDINKETESKAHSKRPIKVFGNSEVEVSNELENLESEPRKILKSKRHSGSMEVSKEVTPRMSLHPSIKLQSGKLKLSEGDMIVSEETVEGMQHESRTEEELKDLNRSQRNRIDQIEVLWKDGQKIPKTSKRHSSEMPISKEVIKRMSLNPNAKLSSGPDASDDLKICKVENVEESTKRQSNSHNQLESTNQDDLSKELENMSANPKKTSKRLHETLPRPKLVLKPVGFDQSIQNLFIGNYSTTTPVNVCWASPLRAKYDPKLSQKHTSTLVCDNSNDDSGTMEVDSSVQSAHTSNEHTSGSEKLEYLNLATPLLQTKRRSFAHKIRPQSVVENLSLGHIPDLLESPSSRRSSNSSNGKNDENCESITELPSASFQLQHLVKGRPKRAKTRAPTRPLVTELSSHTIGEGLEAFFRPGSVTPTTLTPLVSPTSDECSSLISPPRKRHQCMKNENQLNWIVAHHY